MKLMLTLKQRSGLRVIEYLDERGRGVIRVLLGAWRAPQRELGGIPHGGASQVARFAMMLVAAENLPALLTERGDHVRRVEKI